MVEVSILNLKVNNISSNGSLNIGKTLIIKPEVKTEVKEEKEKNNNAIPQYIAVPPPSIPTPSIAVPTPTVTAPTL